MRDLKKKLLTFLVKEKFLVLTLLVCFVFYFPVFFQNKVALPVDALVGAHLPWTEVNWPGYPTGVPIKNLEITDAISQFYPWRSLAGEFWRNLTAPLWNPYILNGTPFLATLHSASLYPLNVVYLLFGNIDSWNILVMSQTFLAAIFTYLLLKKLNLDRKACFLGAVAFAFSGYMIAWLEFATGPHAGLWLPLLLYFLLVLKEKKSALIPISVIVFFVFSAGDFQVPLYVAAIYFCFSLYISRESSFLLRSVFAFIVGLLLSAVQLLPTLELFANSIRGDDPYISDYFYGILHWEKIVNFIWPDFFGNVVTGNYWGKFGFHEYMGFVGVVALIFVLFSLFTRKQKYEKFFVMTLIVTLLFLFPFPTALLPYKLKLPGLSTSSASRLLFVADFCLSVLAAYGLTKWIRIKKQSLNKIVTTLLILTVVVGVMVIVLAKVQSEQAKNLAVALKNMIPATFVLITVFVFSRNKKIGVYLFIFLAVCEMLWYARKNTPFSPRQFVFPQTQTTKFLQENLSEYRFVSGIPLNLHMPYKLNSPEGYDPIYPRANAQWLSLVNFSNKENLSRRYGIVHYFDSEFLDYAGVKYVLDYRKNQYGAPAEKGDYAKGIETNRYKEVFKEGRLSIFENMNVLPKIWITPKFEFKDDQLILVPQQDVVFEVTDFKQGLNEMEFNISTNKNGYLFLSETFYPGWRALVDGIEVEIKKADDLFQSVEIQQGNHSVDFQYYPNSFKIGKYLFIFGALLIFLYYLNEKRTEKRE
ncbi:hypothetical protein A3H21_03010 [Candidatus Woesebacteria bacterium RIFCSPLOWO2_12_FULL_42_8]|nr:MAG: hypothetical protein A3H21_03010 [Candidatus Woesebacteria bacterium RIFCSPLOWO2_12_FULL_42_8]